MQQSCKGAYLSAAWLRRESFHINVLICSRTTCGLARLSARGTSVWRQSPEKQSVVVLSLGWSLPWRFKEQGPGKGSPRQVPFSVSLFPPVAFKALSLLCAELVTEAISSAFPSQLTSCLGLGFWVLFFHKIISQAALPCRIAELLPGFLFLSLII